VLWAELSALKTHISPQNVTIFIFEGVLKLKQVIGMSYD
jgi:hypothetical protein